MQPFNKNNKFQTNEKQIRCNTSPEEYKTLDGSYYLTGYIVAMKNNNILVIAASNKEEAVALRNNLYTLFLRNQIIVVPFSENEEFCIGDKVAVYTKEVTFTIPPQAIGAKIKKIT